MRILLAEDDYNLGRLLKTILGKEGLIVDWVENGEAAYGKVYTTQYDVLVLDWMMPKLSGIDLVKRLREEEYQGKILILTAKDSVEDKVHGLNEGADDYLVKPFDKQELIARIQALSRRQDRYITKDLRCGKFILNSSQHSLDCEGKTVALSDKEYRILEVLFNNKNRVLPREYLQDTVWGIETDITENNLDVYVRKLRQKAAELANVTLIETMRGVGYRAKD